MQGCVIKPFHFYCILKYKLLNGVPFTLLKRLVAWYVGKQPLNVFVKNTKDSGKPRQRHKRKYKGYQRREKKKEIKEQEIGKLINHRNQELGIVYEYHKGITTQKHKFFFFILFCFQV